ncbi:MAG TPA: protein kinase, partial [Kofleriaceae bacterium]|nr:protein kinase [Kofleriaceae bacterium]
MSAEVAAVWCCSNCGAVYHKDYPRCPNDGAEVVLAMRDPLLDKSIGNYVIERLIGEGGMGRVYVARHATLSAKRYAIKVLLGDAAATASMRKRFTQEAESASRLEHPNVVNVLDFGQMASGLPYIVMEYVDGTVLTQLMTKPMDPARVVRIARGICEGLAYAHEAGVVHRDLKPDNVMIVTVDGAEIPRIADFGLATTVDGTDARLTTSGTAMGTPAYAPPEQLAGRQVDARADLYSLGMTMFEMLTGGTLPFEGHIMETMTAKAHREAEPISTIAPTLVLPEGLEALVSKLIRRLSSHRPANAREVMDALDQIALGLAIDERAPTI